MLRRAGIGIRRKKLAALMKDQPPCRRNREEVHAAPERFGLKGVLHHFAATRHRQLTGNMVEHAYNLSSYAFSGGK